MKCPQRKQKLLFSSRTKIEFSSVSQETEREREENKL